MSVIYGIDLLGTFVFAISGALAAYQHKFDLFGAITLAIATAVGGGSIRDVLIGSTPVGWLTDLNYLYIILLSIVVCYFFRAPVMNLRRTLFLFDTVGIGLFAILGTEKTLGAGLDPPIAIMMGVISAVFGGVVRDILVNEQPLIFRGILYATPCFLGAALYTLLYNLEVPHLVKLIVPILTTITVRLLAVKNKWTLPTLR